MEIKQYLKVRGTAAGGMLEEIKQVPNEWVKSQEGECEHGKWAGGHEGQCQSQ